VLALITARRVVIGLVVIVIAVIATLAIPVQTWRTGRMSLPPLTYASPGTVPPAPRRVWIDTDAACGYTPRTDVDDCFALWILATAPEVDIVGVSVVFGNASLEITDATTRELVALLPIAPGGSASVHRGADESFASGVSRRTAARDGLIRALERGALTILALGPLTNVADALSYRPELRKNARLVAVMGRRPGHLFHPTEGAGGATLLGHGPVFRDFNFASDPQAVRAVLTLGVRTTLIPYDAARSIEMTPGDLRELASASDVGAWIASRSEGWVEYWRTDVGREGFYPFDAVAAAYVRAPQSFRCASVRAWVGRDPLMFIPMLRPEGLLVEQQRPSRGQDHAWYCPALEPGFDRVLHTWLYR
jgi:purine nucleosidase